MSDEIDVKIQAKTAGLAAGFAEAQAVVKGAVGEMKASFTSLNGVIDTVKSHWMGIVAVLGGTKLFKDAIDGTIEWTSDIVKLSKRLGITTEEASGLKVALDHLHIGTDEYGTIITKVTRQMRINEQAFESLGIKTHNANGEWRNSQAVMTDVLARLNEMKPGTDRNVAAMGLMGGRVGDLTNLLRLNGDVLKESAEKAERFHLIVGPDGEAKMLAYRAGMADLHLVVESLKLQIGNALIPTLTKLSTQLGSEGPKASNFFAEAIKFIAKAGLEAWAAINALVESVKFFYILLTTPVNMQWLSTVTKAYHDMGDAVLRVNDKVLDGLQILKGIKAGGIAPAAGAPGGSGGDTLGGDDLTKHDPLGELKKQWALLQAQYKLQESQVADSEDAIIGIKAAAAAKALAMFGKDSAEYLAAATDLQNALNKETKDAETIRRDVEKKSFEERKQGWETLFSGISTAMETSVMGIVQGTQTMGAAIKNLLRSITLEYINMGIKTLIAHKATELAKTGATAQGTAQRVALEYWAEVKSVAVSAWGAISRIGMYAIEGAAAAFKAIAAIPFIGPALAPAAAAAAGIAIGAFAGRIASAQGGYDIPSGINPVTQLHQNEMVLPASLAEKVRGMTDGAGSGGGHTFNVYAMDSQDVKKFLRKNRAHLVSVIKGAERDFAFDE